MHCMYTQNYEWSCQQEVSEDVIHYLCRVLMPPPSWEGSVRLPVADELELLLLTDL